MDPTRIAWHAIGLYLRTVTWNSFSSDFKQNQVTITLKCMMAGLPQILLLDGMKERPCLESLQARPTSFISLSEAMVDTYSLDLQQVITVNWKKNNVTVTVTFVVIVTWERLTRRIWRVREWISQIGPIHEVIHPKIFSGDCAHRRRESGAPYLRQFGNPPS